MSSSRVHTVLTGAPDGLRDVHGLADEVGHGVARRPKPPPRNVVCSVTWSGVEAGDLRRAPPGRRSGTACRSRSRTAVRRCRTVQLSGSIGACARYGTTYSTSIVFAARATAGAARRRRRRRWRRPVSTRASELLAQRRGSRARRCGPRSQSTDERVAPAVARPRSARPRRRRRSARARPCARPRPAVRRVVVDRFDAAAEHRRARDHAPSAGPAGARRCRTAPPVDLLRRVEPARRLADDAPVRGALSVTFAGAGSFAARPPRAAP